MEMSIMDNIKKEYAMEQDSFYGKMVIHMMGNGKMEKKMDKDNIIQFKEISIQENMLMVKKKGLEF